MIALILTSRGLVIFFVFFFLSLKLCLSLSQFYQTVQLQQEERETLLFLVRHQQPPQSADSESWYNYYHWLLYSHYHPFAIGGGHDDEHHRGRNCLLLYVAIKIGRALWRRVVQESRISEAPEALPMSSSNNTSNATSAVNSEPRLASMEMSQYS